MWSCASTALFKVALRICARLNLVADTPITEDNPAATHHGIRKTPAANHKSVHCKTRYLKGCKKLKLISFESRTILQRTSSAGHFLTNMIHCPYVKCIGTYDSTVASVSHIYIFQAFLSEIVFQTAKLVPIFRQFSGIIGDFHGSDKPATKKKKNHRRFGSRATNHVRSNCKPNSIHRGRALVVPVAKKQQVHVAAGHIFGLYILSNPGTR